MVSRTIFKNHLLEVGRTQKRETMAPQTLTTIGLFYLILVEGPVTYDFTLHLKIRDHTT
jgi:hypothetical protein